MSTEHWWENTAWEIMKLSEKNPYQCHFLHHKSHIYDFSVQRRRQMATNNESQRTCKDAVVVTVRNYPRICVVGMNSTKKQRKEEKAGEEGRCRDQGSTLEPPVYKSQMSLLEPTCSLPLLTQYKQT